MKANGGRCNCTADHGRDRCGPACRGGQGRCWSCAFIRRCRLV